MYLTGWHMKSDADYFTNQPTKWGSGGGGGAEQEKTSGVELELSVLI